MAQVLMVKIARAFQHAGLTRQYIRDYPTKDLSGVTSGNVIECTNSSTAFSLIDEAFAHKRIDIIDAIAIDGEIREPHEGKDSFKILNSCSEFRNFIIKESDSVQEDQDTLIVLSVNDNEIGQAMFSNDQELAQLLMHPDVRDISISINAARAEFKVDYYVQINYTVGFSRTLSIYKGRDDTDTELLMIDDYSTEMLFTKDAIQNLFKFVRAEDDQTVVFAIKVDDKPTQPLMCKVKDINIHLSDIADLMNI